MRAHVHDGSLRRSISQVYARRPTGLPDREFGRAHHEVAQVGVLGVVVVLALRVPNGEFYARVRRRMVEGSRPVRAAARAVLAQNNLLTFPYRWGFTPDSLSRLVDECGFEVDHLRGDGLGPISDEWTKSWARIEETLIKRTVGTIASLGEVAAPWFELYAKRKG